MGVQMKTIIIIVLTSLLVLGCSQSVVSPDAVVDAGNRPVEGAGFGANAPTAFRSAYRNPNLMGP